MNKDKRKNLISNSIDFKSNPSFKVGIVFDVIVLMILISLTVILNNTAFKNDYKLVDLILLGPFVLVLLHAIVITYLKVKTKRSVSNIVEKRFKEFLEEDLKANGLKQLKSQKSSLIGEIGKIKPVYVSKKYSSISFEQPEISFKYKDQAVYLNEYMWLSWYWTAGAGAKWNRRFTPKMTTVSKKTNDKTEKFYGYKEFKDGSKEAPKGVLEYFEDNSVPNYKKKCFTFAIKDGFKHISVFEDEQPLTFKAKFRYKWSKNSEDFKALTAESILNVYNSKRDAAIKLLDLINT